MHELPLRLFDGKVHTKLCFFAHVDGFEYFCDEKVMFVCVYVFGSQACAHTHHVIDIKLGKE